MNRIQSIFERLAIEGRKAVMPFVTAGYPSLESTGAILQAMDQAGASVCEIGIPFSDPVADGPVIAESMTRALSGGLDCRRIFETVKIVRPAVEMALVAMVSYSIVYRIGVASFVGMAKDAGIDGFIFPDLPLEECEPVNAVVAEAGLSSSLLIAPATASDRAAAIARASSGFVYMLARAGITGERSELPADLVDRVGAIRSVTDLPIAVGFGIANAAHVHAVTQVADAAIVGSALVRRLEAVESAQVSVQAQIAGDFVRELVSGLAE